MRKKIIIFDDNPERLQSLSMLIDLSDDMECAGEFFNTADALNVVTKTQPDLILMDIDMPGGDGISGTKIIKEHFPEIPIVIQTVFEDNDKIFDALKAGANGYLLKKTTPERLLEQLHEALNGEAPMTGSIAVKVLQYFKEEKIEEAYQLTKREKEILSHLVNGYSQKMIAHVLDISANTVSNHIVNIYHKLQVNSATEAVSLAIKKKLV